MSRLFVWISGADTGILARCTNMRRTERTRFAGLGALLLVPGILGAVSMTYALSTVSGQPAVFVTGGLLWGCIVVLIDRYLVSTIYKSRVKSAKGRFVAVLARLAFSVFVGLAVSHPFVMLWFDDSISQELADDRRAALAAVDGQTAASTAGVATGTSAAQLASTTARRECLVQLQTAERVGKQVELPCGFSSPVGRCGPRCQAIGEELERVDADIARLRQQAAAEAASRTAQVEAIEGAASIKKAEITKDFSTDYLARVKALAELERREPEVATVKWFMLLFFVFVDVLPVTMKLTTPSGEYEDVRDTALVTSEVDHRVEREVVHAGHGSPSMVEVAAKTAAMEREITSFSNLSVSLMKLYHDQLTAIDRVSHDISTRAHRTDHANKASVAHQLQNLRDTFNDSWSTIRTRVKSYLTTV
jgi:hypothetical protein